MAVIGSVTLMSGPEGILLPVAQLSCGHRLWKENISDCFNTLNSFLLFLCREKFLSLSQDVLQRCDVSRFFLSDASVLPCSHCENPSDWPIRKGYQLMTNVKVTKYQYISRLSVISLCNTCPSAGLCRYQCARTQNPSAWARFLWGLLRDFQPGGGWARYRPVRSAPETLANTHTSANAVLMLRSHLWLLFYRCGGLQRQSCGTEVDLHWTNSYLYSGRVKLSKRDIKDI